MAAELIGGAIIGGLANELIVLLREAARKCYCFRAHCRRLEQTLKDMLPLMDEALHAGVELNQNRHKQLREFHSRLKRGVKLVEDCAKVGRFNVFQRYKYGRKINSLERYIANFSNKQGWAHTMADMQHLRVDFQRRMEDMQHKIEGGNLTTAALLNQFVSMNINRGPSIEPPVLPELPERCVGLKISVEQLKRRLFVGDVPVLAVTGMGGVGKTTLVTALCQDPEVREYFEDRMLFETVSESPNLIGIIEIMWGKLIGGQMPHFYNVEDAHRHFQHRIQQLQPRRVLLVLDDVWKKSHLEKLLVKGDHKITTLITTRDECILNLNNKFELKVLREEDSMKLFCFWAFYSDEIPRGQDRDLIKQVVAECKGLPLALKVIARSLQNASYSSWKSARDKLAQGKIISGDHKENLLERLATSLEFLEDEVRECFLDLGLFPEDQRNSVDALVDIWSCVYCLNRNSAVSNLRELGRRNLVDFSKPKEFVRWELESSSFGMSFTQHDVLHDLALHLIRQSPLTVCERIVMPQMIDISRKGAVQGQSTFQAKFVSLNTGPMAKDDWRPVNFPNAKVLILNFTAESYFLPPFIQTMHELEVLVIINRSSKNARLDGASVLLPLTKIKSVWFEKVIVPALNDYGQTWQHLGKISLTLCHALGNRSGLQSSHFNFFHLRELTIDHCSNLEKLPESVCKMLALEHLVITNCQDLIKLPEKLGNLDSLQLVKISACPILEELPISICNLKHLQFLDISLCENLRQLPDELGSLSNLREFDMRECSRLKKLPKSCCKLASLLKVVCDENVGSQWLAIQSSIPNIKVEVAEPSFNLDWLGN